MMLWGGGYQVVTAGEIPVPLPSAFSNKTGGEWGAGSTSAPPRTDTRRHGHCSGFIELYVSWGPSSALGELAVERLLVGVGEAGHKVNSQDLGKALAQRRLHKLTPGGQREAGG